MKSLLKKEYREIEGCIISRKNNLWYINKQIGDYFDVFMVLKTDELNGNKNNLIQIDDLYVCKDKHYRIQKQNFLVVKQCALEEIRRIRLELKSVLNENHIVVSNNEFYYVDKWDIKGIVCFKIVNNRKWNSISVHTFSGKKYIDLSISYNLKIKDVINVDVIDSFTQLKIKFAKLLNGSEFKQSTGSEIVKKPDVISKEDVVKSRILKSQKDTKTAMPVTKKQQAIFNNLKIGDVVYCSMPRYICESQTIKKGHDVRPYLVLKKMNDSFVGIQSTSKRHSDYFKISKNDYNSNTRDSYFDLKSPTNITIDLINHYMFSLNTTDFNNIKDSLIQKNKNYSMLFNDIRFDLNKGEIVKDKDDNLYFIYSVKDEVCKCCSAKYRYLDEINDVSVPVKGYGKNYFVNLEQRFEFESNKLAFMDRINGKDIGLIDEVLSEKMGIELHDLKCKYPTGTMFLGLNDVEIMYLYSCDDIDYGMYTNEYFKNKDRNDKVVSIKRINPSKLTYDGIAPNSEILNVLKYHIKHENRCFEFLDEQRIGILNQLKRA